MLHGSVGLDSRNQDPIVARRVRDDVERFVAGGMEAGAAQLRHRQGTAPDSDAGDLDQLIRIARIAAADPFKELRTQTHELAR